MHASPTSRLSLGARFSRSAAGASLGGLITLALLMPGGATAAQKPTTQRPAGHRPAATQAPAPTPPTPVLPACPVTPPATTPAPAPTTLAAPCTPAKPKKPKRAKPSPYLIPPPGPVKPVPKDFAGILIADLPGDTGTYSDQNLATLSASGVHLIRQDFNWSTVETSSGVYDFSTLDHMVLSSAQHDISILPILFGPPGFRAGGPAADPRLVAFLPASNDDMGTFAGVLVARYGPKGTIWHDNPTVKPHPITAWQVWNEPDVPIFWPPPPPAPPDPNAYAAMLLSVGQGIRKVDPRAQIIPAGLAARTHYNWLPYLQALLRSPAAPLISAVAVHPYSSDINGMFSKLKDARTLMNQMHFNKVPIWVTEFGWSTDGPVSPQTVGIAGQSNLVSQAVARMAQLRKPLNLKGFFYFRFQDPNIAALALTENFWGYHTGLVDTNGVPKPSYSSFLAAVAKSETPAKPARKKKARRKTSGKKRATKQPTAKTPAAPVKH